MRKFLLLSVVLLFAIVAMLPARAQAIHTTDTDYGTWVLNENNLWDNFVQFDTGIFATNDDNPDLNQRRGWDNSGTTLTWLITESNGLYTYQYIWSSYPIGYEWEKELSHIIIELTYGINFDGQITAPDATYEIKTTQEEDGPFTESEGNPGMPGDIYGIKIDLDSNATDYTFWVTTDQAPVWGNFYAKGGGGTAIPGAIYAYNTGFDGYPDFSDPGVFIPRPDGAPIPEPATMLLLGAGLIGLTGIGRKKLFKR